MNEQVSLSKIVNTEDGIGKIAKYSFGKLEILCGYARRADNWIATLKDIADWSYNSGSCRYFNFVDETVLRNK